MKCNDCQSENIIKGHITLKNGNVHEIAYCDDCRKVQSTDHIEIQNKSDYKPVHVSWNERKAKAESERKERTLSWAERRARKNKSTKSTVSDQTPPSTVGEPEAF